MNYDEYKKIIGDNISLLRKKNHITQQILADHIGKEQVTISRYENGMTPISIKELCKIAQYFDVSLEDFLNPNLESKLKEDENNDIEDVLLQSKSSIKISKSFFEEKEFYIYYMSTSIKNKIIETYAFTDKNINKKYIEFVFEVEHNSVNNKCYDGKLVLDLDHAYFYFTNKNRSERGMIVTHRYRKKNKDDVFVLMGELISISHGSESNPCTQKCILSTQKVEDHEKLKQFLCHNDNEKFINNKYIDYLDKELDSQFYKWIKGTLE